MENLNAWYGTNHTLHDINLNIPANQCTALIGPSGCGKSTFVRCLNRMHETNPIAKVTGTVDIGNLNIYNDISPVEVRRRIGMVFQRPNPFPTMSIYDNVAAGLRLNGFSSRRILDEVVERSLKEAALWDEVKSDLKKKSGASLSGGQQQRLCIARALAVDPDGQVDRPVRDDPVADLDHQGVDEDHRVDRVQRPGLPFGQPVQYPVGDRADRVPGDLRAVDLGQVGLDLAGGQALGDQRDDQVIDPAQPPLPLGHDRRREAGIPVPRHRDLHRPHVGDHRLGPVPVAGVPAIPPGRVMPRVSQVGIHLVFQGTLEHDLGQPAQQAARARARPRPPR